MVPFRHDAVRCDAQLSHLGVGDLDAGLVGLPHEVGAHTQSGGGAGGAQVVQDGLVAVEGALLQRRLASSPEAIYQSLRRRRERLESRLRELEVLQRGGQHAAAIAFTAPELDADDIADLDDAPEQEAFFFQRTPRRTFSTRRPRPAPSWS